MEVAEAAIRGGADLIQWRDKASSDQEFLKTAQALRDLTKRLQVIFVVNDRVDVASLVGADGVHLGHEDLPIERVRAWVGSSMLIGRSTHSLEEAKMAESSGADYIGVGPVYSTPTKPDYKAVGLKLVESVGAVIRIPWFAIGGIDFEKISEVLSAGATRVALVRALAGADDPCAAACALKAQMQKR